MAVSVRYHNPGLPIALAVDETAKAYVLPHEREKLYDHVIDIDPGHMYNESQFAPGLTKLHMDSYSPFDETIYLDVDGLCIRPLDGLFGMCAAKDVCSQVNSVTTEEAETWPCQWMSLDDTKKVYGFGGRFRLPEINSSFMYWKKSEAATAYFDVARQCFLPTYKTSWGKSFPDELAFNVAAGLLGMDISVSPDADCPVVFRTKAADTSKLEPQTYVLGLYGEKSHHFLKVYEMYGRYSMKYWVSVMGRTCPYKYGQLMGRKFVSLGRSLAGKPFAVPEPITVNLPVAKTEEVRSATTSKKKSNDET